VKAGRERISPAFDAPVPYTMPFSREPFRLDVKPVPTFELSSSRPTNVSRMK
jgi:hypothetical protein